MKENDTNCGQMRHYCDYNGHKFFQVPAIRGGVFFPSSLEYGILLWLDLTNNTQLK